MLLRVYRRPFYTESLAAQAITLLPWALVLHLPVAVWVFGSPSLVRADAFSVDGGKALLKAVAQNFQAGGGAEAKAKADALAEESGSALGFLAPFDPLEAEGGFAWRAARLPGALPLLLLLALACWHAFHRTGWRLLVYVHARVVQLIKCDFGTFEHQYVCAVALLRICTCPFWLCITSVLPTLLLAYPSVHQLICHCFFLFALFCLAGWRRRMRCRLVRTPSPLSSACCTRYARANYSRR